MQNSEMFQNGNTRNPGIILPTKYFSNRKSLLLELKHFEAIKHGFLALLFGFVSRDIIAALTKVEGGDFSFTLIKTFFSNFHLAMIFWIALFAIHLSMYVLFNYWAQKRITFKSKPTSLKLWNILCITVNVSYIIISLSAVPVIAIKYLELGLASSIAILQENLRLLMKTYAFIRSNVPEVLNYSQNVDSNLYLPTLSNYIYFSFAPTLIYRKEYPRRTNININKVVIYFCEFLMAIWLQSFIYETYFVKPFKDIGKSKIEWQKIAVTIMENALGGGLSLLLDFYILLHAWLNAFAELLTFADRRFYEDWWISTNLSTYYRRWNIVVHDWLFEYIYVDFHHHIVPKNKVVAKLAVFTFSALLHEYVLSFSFRHFLPILFVMFMLFGATLTALKTKHLLFNVLLLYGIALGSSIHLSLHMIEYYARQNCPYENNGYVELFVPRFITLNCQ